MNQTVPVQSIANAESMSLDEITNLIATLYCQQRDDEALQLVDFAIKYHDPSMTVELIRGMKGILALARGDYKTGWPLFEMRTPFYYPGVPIGQNKFRYTDGEPEGGPQWDGQPTDKRVLFWSEGGLGDSIMMLRFLPEATRRCPNSQLEIQIPLLRLCAGMAKEVYASFDCEPHFDYQCSLMSLPLILKANTLDDIPTQPYLKANPILVEKFWRPRNQHKLGVVWRGNKLLMRAQVRDILDMYLTPLCRKFNFVSLTHEHATYSDVLELAGLIETLDVVVSVDTMIAHLAGAMGKKVFLMLGMDCDWRWMRNRIDSPWYPTMRLFRQKTAGDWEPVIAEVCTALEEMGLANCN